MLGWHCWQWYNTEWTKKQVNVCTGHSEYDSIWNQIYIYFEVQKLSGDFWSLKLQYKITVKKT